jgi:ribose transport system ATP-binding protein
VAIVYISHRLGEVMALADRVTVFRDGRHVLTKPIAELDEDRIIAAMVGREMLAVEHPPSGDASGAILSVRDLGLAKPHRRGWRDVLTGVSFDLHAGEILGIGGLLGSGRTEILESLFGAAHGQVSGEIRVDGAPADLRTPRDARRLGLAFVTEDRKTQGLHLASSIVDNVALPLVSRLSFLGLRSARRERSLAEQAVRTLAIRCSGIEQDAGKLSGGNQQKVVMGKWLATQPRILLLDEPTRGIDVGAKREIYDLIFRLAREQGLGVVVVSSELPELLLLADRILVMSEGRQRGILRRADATEERVMQLAAPTGHRVAA